MTFTTEQAALLNAPLNAANVKKNPRGFDYVEAWHVIAEANRIFGFDGWTRETVDMRQLGEPRIVNNNTRVGYMAKVRITAGGVVREGCGFGQGINSDVDMAHESALKEAESDAMKRALMTFGNPFGLALYDKKQENVVVDPPKRSQPFLVAVNTLESYQRDPIAFREFWEKNKDGFKANFEPPEYADLVAHMKRIAASMPKPDPRQPGEPPTHTRNGKAIPETNPPMRTAMDLISQDEIPF